MNARIIVKCPVLLLTAVSTALTWFSFTRVPEAVAGAACKPGRGIGVEATWGLEVLAAILKDERNVVIPIGECELDGFFCDISSEYRRPSARRRAKEGTITATAAVAGTFHFAFIFYDGKGAERIGIRINGENRGTAVADVDDNRQRLFFLTEPCTFTGGERIELRNLNSDGGYRFEDLLLLKEKPPGKRHTYLISEVLARPEVTGDKTSASLTWITNWPAACTIEWKRETQAGPRGQTGRSGPSSPAAGSSECEKLVEKLAVNNHRVVLTGLQPRARYRFRITATDREGKGIATEWRTFSTRPAVPVEGRVKRGRVPLTVENSLATEDYGASKPSVLTNFPVTSGVPFAEGALGSDKQLRLLDGQNNELPLQARTLARWHDGSVKWVLLDFQAPEPASEQTACYLEYGTQVKRGDSDSPLEVTQADETVTVVTGPVRLTIAKRRCGFLESVFADTDGDGTFEDSERIISPERPGAFYLTGPEGTVYSSLAPPDEVMLEECGPLRAVVRVRGRHRAADGRRLFAYNVRIHAYAGQPFIRAEHTFINDFSGAEFTIIKGLTLSLPLATCGTAPEKPRWALGEAENHKGVLGATRAVRLKQHLENHYSILVDGRLRGEAERAAGWATWSDGARAVTLAVRDFWQNYPKDLTLTPDTLELAICPPLGEDQYLEAKGTVDEHKLYYYMQGGLYKLRQGVSKTHDIWLDFSPTAHQAVAAGGRASSCIKTRRAPLLAVAPPAWYVDSRVFGKMAAPGTTGLLAEYDTVYAGMFEMYLAAREHNRAYGMLNFGDWYGERYFNWGNSEYDTQHALLLQFVRTGHPPYFRAAEQMEWHNRDVDTIHCHRDRSRIGRVYAHCIGHTGDYYGEKPEPGKGTPRGGLSIDHTWVEGHLDYYFLTGDHRSFETARKIADRYNTYGTCNYDFTNCRVPGWHLILTMAMYNATNDRFYLNAAKIIVERVLERQTPDGGWKRQLIPGHCHCLPRHHGDAGFMVGILLTGLKRYYQVTGDERAARAIVGGARFLVNDMWEPELRRFRYTSCPKSPPTTYLTLLLCDGIAFAHQRTGDPRLRKVLIEGLDTAFKSTEELTQGPDSLKQRAGWGKLFTMWTREAPYFIEYVARLKEGAWQ